MYMGIYMIRLSNVTNAKIKLSKIYSNIINHIEENILITLIELLNMMINITALSYIKCNILNEHIASFLQAKNLSIRYFSVERSRAFSINSTFLDILISDI